MSHQVKTTLKVVAIIALFVGGFFITNALRSKDNGVDVATGGSKGNIPAQTTIPSGTAVATDTEVTTNITIPAAPLPVDQKAEASSSPFAALLECNTEAPLNLGGINVETFRRFPVNASDANCLGLQAKGISGTIGPITITGGDLEALIDSNTQSGSLKGELTFENKGKPGKLGLEIPLSFDLVKGDIRLEKGAKIALGLGQTNINAVFEIDLNVKGGVLSLMAGFDQATLNVGFNAYIEYINAEGSKMEIPIAGTIQKSPSGFEAQFELQSAFRMPGIDIYPAIITYKDLTLSIDGRANLLQKIFEGSLAVKGVIKNLDIANFSTASLLGIEFDITATADGTLTVVGMKSQLKGTLHLDGSISGINISADLFVLGNQINFAGTIQPTLQPLGAVVTLRPTAGDQSGLRLDATITYIEKEIGVDGQVHFDKVFLNGIPIGENFTMNFGYHNGKFTTEVVQ